MKESRITQIKKLNNEIDETTQKLYEMKDKLTALSIFNAHTPFISTGRGDREFLYDLRFHRDRDRETYYKEDSIEFSNLTEEELINLLTEIQDSIEEMKQKFNEWRA